MYILHEMEMTNIAEKILNMQQDTHLGEQATIPYTVWY